MKRYGWIGLLIILIIRGPLICQADTLRIDTPLTAVDTLQHDTATAVNNIPKPPELNEIFFRNKLKNRWLFFIVCAIMLLYGLNRVINIRRHDQLMTGSLLGMVLKSNEAVYSELSFQTILSGLVSATAAALALFYWLPFNTPEVFQHGIQYFGFLIVLVLFLSAVKAFLYYFVGSVLEWKELSIVLLIQNISINYICFLLITPWVLIDHYLDQSFVNQIFPHLALILFIVFTLLRIYRTVRAMAAYWPYAYLYLFLYLCALEILPWLITMRLFRVFG